MISCPHNNCAITPSTTHRAREKSFRECSNQKATSGRRKATSSNQSHFTEFSETRVFEKIGVIDNELSKLHDGGCSRVLGFCSAFGNGAHHIPDNRFQERVERWSPLLHKTSFEESTEPQFSLIPNHSRAAVANEIMHQLDEWIKEDHRRSKQWWE